MSAELLNRAREGLDWIAEKKGGYEAEIFIQKSRDRGLELKNGKPFLNQESSEEGVGLRLRRDGRMSFAFAGGDVSAVLPDVFKRAASQLTQLPENPHQVLPFPAQRGGEKLEGFEASLYDPNILNDDVEQWTTQLADMDERARRHPRVVEVSQIGFGESVLEMGLASTTGVANFEKGTYSSFGLTVRVSDGDSMEVGSGYRIGRRRRDVDAQAAVDEAVSRTAKLLGARAPTPKRRCAVFDPWVAGELLDLLACSLSAEAVLRGRSFLRGGLGRKIGSSMVNFMDDPLKPGGLSSGRFDDEGIPTRAAAIVDHGVLREYFYDSCTAHEAERISNGCAGRSGFRGPPSASASNFYLMPGRTTRRELILDTNDGILVTEIMGMHTADPVSGEISVGISGVMIKRGRLTHGVRGAMLSCNILDVWERVDGVADDLIFYGSLGAPTFRAADLTIG